MVGFAGSNVQAQTVLSTMTPTPIVRCLSRNGLTYTATIHNVEEKMTKLYSPMQVSLATYLGGPLSAIYFLKVNFDARGESTFSKRVTFFGSLFTIMLIVAIPVISPHLSSSIIPLLYLFPVMFVVHKYQLSKQEISDSKEFSFHSNWRVCGLSILWMLAYLILAVLVKQALISVGIISAV
jgi:hypothetical protein